MTLVSQPLPELVSVAFGSNQGDSKAIIQGAIATLSQHPEITIESQSRWFWTPPMGPPQPDFINGCLLLKSTLPPDELLNILLNIEQNYGRMRRVHWGPRTLDLDLLFYGDRIIQMPNLTIPHPGLHERPFVLIPLCDICPDWVHPRLNLSIRDLLASLDCSQTQRVVPVFN